MNNAHSIKKQKNQIKGTQRDRGQLAPVFFILSVASSNTSPYDKFELTETYGRIKILTSN
jgi:hypothetical protein